MLSNSDPWQVKSSLLAPSLKGTAPEEGNFCPPPPPPPWAPGPCCCRSLRRDEERPPVSVELPPKLREDQVGEPVVG